VLDWLKGDFQAALLAGSGGDLTLQILILAAGALLGAGLWTLWRRRVNARLGDQPAGDFKALSLRASKRLVFPLVLALVALLAHEILGQSGRRTGLLDIAVPLMLALVAVRLLIFLLRVGGGGERRLTFWEYLISTGVWLTLALYLLGWLPAVEQALERVALQFGESRVSLSAVLRLALAGSLLLLLSLSISRLLEVRVERQFLRDPALGKGLAKVVRYTLVVVAFLVAFNSVGLDLTSLTVVGGALGVGLGFGLQKVASNLVSGYLLLFDRSIRPGDVINIGESYGWVQKLAARYIVVRDRNGVDTLIPNEKFVTTEVINWSYGDRDIRLKLPVQISYGDDPELAMRLMDQAANASPRVIADPPPGCRLMGFGDNGIQLELRVWIADPENGVNNVRSDINLAIWRAFKANGITIPYPQRDLHIKESGLPAKSEERQVDRRGG
jgi:small-conductance mechanosensitive channel